MGKVIKYGPSKVYTQKWSGLEIKVGGNYTYFNDRVKVLEINAAEDGSGAEVLIQGSFESRGNVDADELGPYR